MNRRIFTIAAVLLATITSPAQVAGDTVLFDFDSYRLNPAAKNRLNTLLNPLLKGRQADSIVIKTHCDGLGTHYYNDRLSERRSQSVKLYMAPLIPAGEKQHPPPPFKSYACGKRQPLYNNRTPGNRQLNRRAVIYIYYSDSAAATAGPHRPPKNNIAAQLNAAKQGGPNIVLQNILFQGGRHVLLPSSYNELDTLLAAMLQNPALQIEIQGHICCEPGTGDGLDFDTQTYDLSAQRAKAVYRYLVEHGVAPGRMRYTGFGHQRPLTAERNEEERQQNRRVEIRVLKQ